LKWLVLFHVVTAIVGIGPTYFLHVLYRRRQSVGEMKQSLRLGNVLELFPKTGGTLSVLSGIVLVVLSPARFLELWIVGSLLLYALIQLIVFAIVAPRQKRIRSMLDQPGLRDKEMLPGTIQAVAANINGWLYVVSALGILLFIFMIWKPVL